MRGDPAYARVSPRFWTETQASGWSPDMVMLGLYLLTNEHRTTEGIYRLPVQYMAADLPGEWGVTRVTASLDALVAEGFVQYDPKARVVFLPKALKYQRPDNGNQQVAAIKSIRSLPATHLLRPFLEAADRYAQPFAQALRKAFPQGFPQGYGDPPAPTPAPTPVKPSVESASDSTADEEPVSGEIVPASPPTADDFSPFWSAYPNKQGKQPAMRTWRRMKPHERADATEVAAAMAYCVSLGYRERDKCPHASTFLHQRRWEEWRDEDGELRAPPGYGPNSNGRTEADQIEAVAARVAAARGEL